MTAMIVFVTAVFLLSTIVAYACWVRARVVMFQACLSSLRDGLMESAEECDVGTDPLIRFLHERLAEFISAAPAVSTSMLLFSLISETDTSEVPEATSEPAKEVANRFALAFSRLTCRYIFFGTLSGMVVLGVGKLLQMSVQLHKKLLQLTESYLFGPRNHMRVCGH